MVPSAALVAALLAFASNVTGLPVPHDATPQITLTHQARDGRPLGLYPTPEAGMLYWDNGEILLYADWREGEGSDKCMLAHELTHWLQLKAGHSWRPVKDVEAEAYLVTLECSKAYQRPLQEIEWAESMVRDPHIVK